MLAADERGDACHVWRRHGGALDVAIGRSARVDQGDHAPDSRGPGRKDPTAPRIGGDLIAPIAAWRGDVRGADSVVRVVTLVPETPVCIHADDAGNLDRDHGTRVRDVAHDRGGDRKSTRLNSSHVAISYA